MTQVPGFRARLLAHQTLVGTFLKTPTGHGVEIIGDAGFDFVVIDQEHSPFDRSSIDVALAIACARGLPGLVRVAGPETILSVLDGGATGILMPHVASVEQARTVAAACRYRGGRGFATSTRAGRYTATPAWEHIDRSDAETVVIAQIEDVAALPHVDAIAAVEGIDSLFIGRGDLTAAFGDRDLRPAGARGERRDRRGCAPDGPRAQRLLRRGGRSRVSVRPGREPLHPLIRPGLSASGGACLARGAEEVAGRAGMIAAPSSRSEETWRQST
jgi:2-keto-3-deoxy-L-rhamnonate aldolase RhmA